MMKRRNILASLAGLTGFAWAAKLAKPVVTADFTATPLNGEVPLTVQFLALPTGPVTGYVWDFGDGGTSTNRDPQHTYGSVGSFTPRLTVKGKGITGTHAKPNYITVAVPAPPPPPPPPPDVTWVGVIPHLTFAQAGSYDLKQHTSGFDLTKHDMVLAPTSSPLPAGDTLVDGVLTFDAGAEYVSGLVVDIVDRVAAPAPTPSPAPPVVAGLVAFAQRSTAPGVVRAFAFDKTADLGAGPGGFGYGYNYGWYDDGNPGDHPVIDPTMAPPGTSGGSLLMTLDATRGGGAWVTNFSEDLKTRFNLGQEFFCQWRQRFNAAMLGGNVGLFGSWKQCLVSTGDTAYHVWDGVNGVAGSCRCCEICLTSYEFATSTYPTVTRFPIAYHACPGCYGQVNLTEPDPNLNFLFQNEMPAPFCGYNNAGVASGQPNNCWRYRADEWETFQIGITIGPTRNPDGLVPNSRVRIWAQHEGEASQLLIDRNLSLSLNATDPGYGKFWFTARNPYGRNTTMKTWCSQLIISTQRLPDAL